MLNVLRNLQLLDLFETVRSTYLRICENFLGQDSAHSFAFVKPLSLDLIFISEGFISL